MNGKRIERSIACAGIALVTYVCGILHVINEILKDKLLENELGS